ncbi:MAG: ABC transporter permease [Verrucomicrobiota bacterium]|nr:ABC transporter permease [Verrucomicrobiota bacterium]
MSTFITDLRYAIRMLLKSPGFTIIAIAALALGIGANTAIFSVVDAVLLRALPYPQPERLVLLRERSASFPNGSVSYPNFLDWRAGQHTLTDLALLRRESFNFSTPGGETAPERIGGGRVTYNFLTILGLKPLLGRDFTEGEDAPGTAPVAMISEALWRSHFGASPKVLGRQIMLDGITREIIGVLPGELRYPRASEILVPLAELRKEPSTLSRGNHPGYSSLGRLKPGVSLAQANADLDTIAANLEQQYPDTNATRRVQMQPLLEAAVGEYRNSLNLLLGAVGCVLLIACANVANLQLARALARTKELAIRAALGASRWRLARQLLTESTLLALAGATAGVFLAVWSLDGILALSPANVARFQETRIDRVALMFTAVVGLLAGVLAGLWPAWKISNTAALSVVLHEAGTRGGSGGANKQRARSALVITQVALAVILLAGAGLTLKSFWRAQQAPLNFDPNGILTITIALPEARYDKDEKVNAFYTQLLEKVRALPGIESVAIGSNIPFDDTEWDSSFHLTGTPENKPGTEPSAEINAVSPDYFRVMGMPIIRGRTFGPEEVPGQPRSVIIDESLVRRFFKGVDPIGQHIDDNQSREKTPPPLTIVGVVARTRNEAPGEDNVEKLNFAHMYFATSQYAQTDVTLVVRTSGNDPLAFASAIKQQVQALDPQQPVGKISTMQKNITASLAGRRLTMVLLAAFAGLALVLASVGLYGVMALSVTQRTRELGIRLALGAARADVFRLVLGQGAALVGLGLGLGLLGAIAAGRALASVLYNVGTLDLAALLTALISLAVVALLACFFPARRATRVDPMVALREE